MTFKCILYINIYQQNNEKERGSFMKKILSMITAMAMIFCLFPPVRSFAADTETVGYIAYVSDGNGGYKAQTKTAECTVIDSANIISSLTNGQYAVKDAFLFF